MVLMASRLLWQKGSANSPPPERYTRARFLLLGEPDCGHPVRCASAHTENWRDAGDVEWMGWCHDMPTSIAQSHMSACHRRTAKVYLASLSKPLRLVVLLSTDTPGCRRSRPPWRQRYRRSHGQPRSPNISTRTSYQNAPVRKAMGIRAREIALIEFSLKQVNDATIAVYRSLLTSIPIQRGVRTHCGGLARLSRSIGRRSDHPQ